MDLTILARVVAVVVGGWLAALLAIVAVQAWRGRIVTRGMLAPARGRASSASRMQLVLATIAVALGYAGAALTTAPGAGLPDIPVAIVVALIGSQGVYLGNKGFGGRGRA